MEIEEKKIGGISYPANNQTKEDGLVEGEDDLANNLTKKMKIKGPKLRPVVGAYRASSRPMSHILSKVIYKVSEIIGRKIRTNCESTEEMIFEIEEVNKSIKENEEIVVGSLDIVKWYPSMRLKRLIEIVMELMMEADMDVSEIDIENHNKINQSIFKD